MSFVGLTTLQAKPYRVDLAHEVFTTVWSKVDESFYDRTFGGVDWKKTKEEYHEKVAQTKNNEELRSVLNAMLGELGRSHFAVTGVRNFQQKRSTGNYLGLKIRSKDRRLWIYRVAENSPASKAGLKAGMEIVKIENEAMSQVFDRHSFEKDRSNFFKYKALEEIRVEMIFPEDGKTTIHIAGVAEPFDFSPGYYQGKRSGNALNLGSQELDFEERALSEREDSIRLMRFNIFLPSLMPQIREAVFRAQKKGARGLIIDLRGNPGGMVIMATGLTGLLIDEDLDLGDMINPQGNLPFHAFPQKGAYLGPVAVLIDSFSASTSEIFAAGLQEAGRARLFGRPTTAAVLPSIVENLPNGDSLQYAIGDFITARKKISLEGRGVTPDEIVSFDPKALRENNDPDLAAATRWIQSQTQPHKK